MTVEIQNQVACAECGALIDVDDSHEIDGKHYCGDCTICCESCGDYVRTDDAKTSDRGDCYCESCYDDKFVRCEGCGCEVRRDHSYSSDDGNDYCSDCYHENYTCCERCNCEVSTDDSYTDDDGNCYCETCYHDLYCHCESCDHEISNDDAICIDGNVYCESCAPSGGEWEAGNFRPVQSSRLVGSRRSFGVELETSACPDYEDLEGRTIFGAKEDASISGKEFVSPILSTDAGLDAVNQFCALAVSNDFAVDSKCGFHAHFDVRDLCTAQLKSVAYAYHRTYEAWAAFVSSSRRSNHYCKAATWDSVDLHGISDMEGWQSFTARLDRYAWVNLHAYNKHGTFEVRLHNATLDGEKVCNWIKAHTRFIDGVRNKTFAEIDRMFGHTVESAFAGLAKLWDDTELTAFYAERAEKFGTTVTSREYAAA
jgi:hypothetical protein